MVGWVSDCWEGSNLGNWNGSLDDGTFLVDDSVESVNWIGSVLNDAAGAIRFNAICLEKRNDKI